MSIFSRLNFNFDTSKFGTAVNFSPEVAAYMNTAPDFMTQWQLNDMNSGTTGNYFQNPMESDLNNIKTYVTTINSTSANTLFKNLSSETVDSLITSAENLSNEVTNFKEHTDRISGVTKSTDTSLYPDFDSAMSVSKTIIMLVKQSDGIQNNTPILANFTSLFIKDDVAYSKTTISTDKDTFNGSLTPNANSAIYTYDSNLSEESANTIINHLTSTYNLMNTRRNGDVNYYLNSLTVMDEFQTTSQINGLGDMGSYLVNNFIGTTKLINNLSS